MSVLYLAFHSYFNMKIITSKCQFRGCGFVLVARLIFVTLAYAPEDPECLVENCQHFVAVKTAANIPLCSIDKPTYVFSNAFKNGSSPRVSCANTCTVQGDCSAFQVSGKSMSCSIFNYTTQNYVVGTPGLNCFSYRVCFILI